MVASVWSQAPSTIVMDLVASANPGFVSVRNSFQFLDAPSGDNLPEGTLKNTAVTITPTPEGAATYEGDVRIAYQRLTVGTYLDAVTTDRTFSYDNSGTDGTPVIAEGMAAADILAAVKIILGIDLSEAQPEFDTAAFALTKVTDTQYTIVLFALPGAWLFTGSETITVNLPVPKTQTSSVVTNSEMDGLDAPQSS